MHIARIQPGVIKPTDKNLGIVLMNTDDYISQCPLHLTDSTTYRPTKEYPKQNVRRELISLTTTFREQLKPSVGDRIESRRPCSALHFHFYVFCTFSANCACAVPAMRYSLEEPAESLTRASYSSR